MGARDNGPGNRNGIRFMTGQTYILGCIFLLTLGGFSVLAVSFGAFSGNASTVFFVSACAVLFMLLMLFLSRVKVVTVDAYAGSVVIKKLVPVLGRTRTYCFDEIREVCFVVDYAGVTRYIPIDTCIKLNLVNGRQVRVFTNRDSLPRGFSGQGKTPGGPLPYLVDAPFSLCQAIASAIGAPILKRTMLAGRRVRGSVTDEYVYPEGTEASRAEDFSRYLAD